MDGILPDPAILLPHRERWSFVEAIERLEDGVAIARTRAVTPSELAGHFPGYPVVPGVLQIEMMAQAAGLLLARNGRSGGRSPPRGALISIQRARFARALPPSESAQVTVKLEVAFTRGVLVSGEVRHNGEVTASARLAVALQGEPGE